MILSAVVDFVVGRCSLVLLHIKGLIPSNIVDVLGLLLMFVFDQIALY